MSYTFPMDNFHAADNFRIPNGDFPKSFPLFSAPFISVVCVLGRLSRYSDSLRAGDGLGIECRLGRYFPHPSRPALVPTQPPVQWVPGLFSGCKAAGVWSWPPIPFYRQGERKSEVVPLFPSCAFVACSWVNFNLRHQFHNAFTIALRELTLNFEGVKIFHS
jgi:hypothetical protein